jgi:hypothetical protein
MRVHLREACFAGPNSPARVGCKHTEMIRNPCPNHDYRPRARRKGQTARFCRLCLNQQEMADRWKNVRKAFVTIRSSTRKRLAAVKPPGISAAAKQWKFSIVASLRPDCASERVRVLIGIDCEHKVLSND